MTLASLKLCTGRSIRQQLPPWLPAFRQSCQIAKEAPLTCSKLSIWWEPRQVSCIESFTSFDFGPKARSGKGNTGQDPKFLPWKANSSLVAKEQPDKEHLNSRFCPQNATDLPTEAGAWLPYLRYRACVALFHREPKASVVARNQQAGQLPFVQRAIVKGKGQWVMPCGFLNSGETPEQAAVCRRCRN